MNKASVWASLSGTLLLLSACGGHQYVKNNTPKSAEKQALAECKYQAESATATVGTGDKPGSYGDAVSGGVASGVEKGMEQSDLIDECMQAKGYSR